MSASSRPYWVLSPMSAIGEERDYQDRKWGDESRHPWSEWAAILGAEVGEVCTEIKDLTWHPTGDKEQLSGLRSELIQVAAVCVAMVEQIDDIKDTDGGEGS
jgi:NTP pyrophosphatase (non-canonical NTP hydrolase)